MPTMPRLPTSSPNKSAMKWRASLWPRHSNISTCSSLRRRLWISTKSSLIPKRIRLGELGNLPVRSVLPATLLLLGLSVFTDANAKEPNRLVDYVRPSVGTQGEGNTYPGPSAPFGMIQLSPDTDNELWETASGYEYSDSTTIGFSL